MQNLRFWCACLVLLIASPLPAEAETLSDAFRSCPAPSGAGQKYHAVWHRMPLILNDVTRGMAFRVLLSLAGSDVFGVPEIYVTFDTRSPGASLPDWVRAAYPKEITIVLQYQFADLAIGRNDFGVGLWFHGRPAQVRVPFDAVTLFLDGRMSFCYVALPSEGGPTPPK